MLVMEDGETFAYTFQGEWLVGYEELGHLDPDSEDRKVWTVARGGEKGKFVAYSVACRRDAAGKIIVTDTYQELETKIPQSIYQALEIALGVREPDRPAERTLDV